MSVIGHMIGGAFGGGTEPFAVHSHDRAQAARYLMEAVRATMSWAEAEQDIRSFLAGKGITDPTLIQEQVDRARPLLHPWLS